MDLSSSVNIDLTLYQFHSSLLTAGRKCMPVIKTDHSKMETKSPTIVALQKHCKRALYLYGKRLVNPTVTILHNLQRSWPRQNFIDRSDRKRLCRLQILET